MIKVLIVDDHELVRLGLATYIGVQPDLEVVDQAENGQEGVDMALKDRPDIILMDLVMPVKDGITATKEILKAWPQARIIILTSFIDDAKVYPAWRRGRPVTFSRQPQPRKLPRRFGKQLKVSEFWSRKSRLK